MLEPALAKVNIVLPRDRQAVYLRPALDAVLAQSYGNNELIVVNDGSTDGTGQELAQCAPRWLCPSKGSRPTVGADAAVAAPSIGDPAREEVRSTQPLYVFEGRPVPLPGDLPSTSRACCQVKCFGGGICHYERTTSAGS